MHLGWIDYGVLIVLLSFSVFIGIYQGCFRSQQLTTNEFLVANGEMRILPTSMSLLASIMSAAALLGIPNEIYSFGTMYLYWFFAYFIGTYFTVKLFIPMYRRIGNLSIYAYLEQRFSSAVRLAVTLTYILITIFYISVILYGPSLALSQVTGLNIWLAVMSCGIICTIYTSVGGMKAVIWTDVTQTIMMFLGVIISIIFGFIDAGGIKTVYKNVVDGKRLQLSSLTFDPSVRYTIWSVVIGGGFNAIAFYSCLQTQAQRYLCVRSTRSAQKVAWMNFFMCSVMLILCTIVGCLLYSKYHECDPLQSKLITKPDQLYPLFVIQTLGRFPGLTGLFIASILSASLSTASSGINSIATVFLEDIFKKIFLKNIISDEKQAILSKLLSIFIGVLIIFLAFLASYLSDNIIIIVFQISGAFVAPILGVYLVGFFIPRNVLIAFILCLIFQTWILLGATFVVKPQPGKGGRLMTSISRCSSTSNITQILKTNSNSNIFYPLYSMSVIWYSFNAVMIIIIISLLLAIIFGSNDREKIDETLLIPWKNIFTSHSNDKTLTISKTKELQLQNIEKETML